MKGELVAKAVAEVAAFIALYAPLIVVTNGAAATATEVRHVAEVRIVQAASVTTRGTAVPLTNDPMRAVLFGTDRSAVSDRVAVLLADSSAKQTLFSAYVDEVIALMTALVGVSVLLVTRIRSYVKSWGQVPDQDTARELIPASEAGHKSLPT